MLLVDYVGFLGSMDRVCVIFDLFSRYPNSSTGMALSLWRQHYHCSSPSIQWFNNLSLFFLNVKKGLVCSILLESPTSPFVFYPNEIYIKV